MTKTNDIRKEMTKYLEALEAGTRALLDIDEPRLVLRTIAEQVRKIAEIDECSIILFQDEDKAVVVASSERPDMADTVISISNYPELQRVIETKQPLLIGDVSTSPLLDEVRELLHKKRIRGIAVMPIFVGDEMLGALFLRLTRVGDPLGNMPISYFQATANSAALALRNIKLKKDVDVFRRETHDARQEVLEEQRYRRRYQELFHLASDGLLIINQKGQVLDANKKFEQLTGYTFNESMQLNYLDIISPEEREKAEKFFLEYRKNPASKKDHFSILTKNKETKHVLVSVDLLTGEENQALVSLHNMTEEKNLQHQLQRTKEFFENLINSSVDAILAADMKGNIIIFNEGAEKILGYKPDEILGKTNIIDLYAPGAAKNVMRKLRSPEYGGVGKLETTHYNVIDKDGEEIPINVSAALVYENGKEIASVGIFQDLRPRMRIERELRASQEKLVEAEKQAALAALSGATAHELNQPLTSIMGYSELLQKRLSDDDEVVNKAINTIMRETERMSDIIQKIGRISHFRTRDYVGRTKIVDLDESSMPKSRYENLFLSMGDGLLELKCDETGLPVECVFANPAAVRLLGRVTVSDLMERSVPELFGSQEVAKKIIEEAKKGDAGNPVTVNITRPDGLEVIVEIVTNLVETGDSTSAVELLCRDVTERVKVQKELQEAEQQARTLLEMAGEVGIGIIMLTLEGSDRGQTIFANERLEHVLDCKVSEMRTFPFLNLVSPADRDKFEEIYESALEGDIGVHHVHAEVVRRNGVMIPIEFLGSTTRYMGLRVLIGFVQDVTEWVDTREELRRVKEFNENIVNNAPIGIVVVDTDGVVLSINDYHREIMGLPSKDVAIGLNLFDLSNIVGTEIEELVRKGLDGESVSIPRFSYTSITGKPMVLRAEGVPLTNDEGKVRGGLILLEDVTEEAKLEENLRRERAYHENIIEQSPVPITGISPDFSIVLFNKAAEELSGYSRKEMLGKSIYEIFPSDQITPEIIEKNFKRIESGEVIKDFPTRITTKRGDIRELISNVIPIKDEKGALTSLVSISRDVTEENKLAKETARGRKVLEATHRIARASIEGSELQHIYNILKTELADIIDHDLLAVAMIKQNKLDIQVLNKKDLNIPKRGTFPLEGTFSETLIKSKKPRLLKDHKAKKRLYPDEKQISAAGIRSGINLPLQLHDQVIGTINIGSKKPNAFSKEDFQIFRQIADEFAIALENIRLMKELRRSNEDLARKTSYLETMLQSGRKFRIDMDERDVVHQYVRNIEKLFATPHLVVYLTEPQRNILVPAYMHQLPPEKAKRPLKIEGTIKRWMKTRKDYIYYRDLKRVKSYKPSIPDVRSALIIPIRISGNLLGALFIESHTPSYFNSDDVDLIVLMSRQMAVSINNIRLFEQACFLERTQENILENASALIVTINREGIVTTFNKAIEKFTGFSKKEVIGAEALKPWSETGQRKTALQIWKNIKDGRELRNYVINLYTKKGKTKRAVFNSTAVRNAKGDIAQYVFVGYDLTDREAIERQLAQSAKMATLGQMAAGIAHELSNPLTAISSYSQLLLRNLKKSKGKEKQTLQVERILEGVDRIERLVGNLMDYSRMDYEEEEPVEINETIEEALGFSEFDLAKGNVKIIKKLNPKLPSVIGIAGQLQQVFINLFLNASYSLQKQGGGYIKISSRRGPKGTIRVEIADDGPGISPDDVKRIFEPFYTTKPRGEGTGLGLSIVRDIVEKHGGDITVKSSPDKGSVFRITLPSHTPAENVSDGR